MQYEQMNSCYSGGFTLCHSRVPQTVQNDNYYYQLFRKNYLINPIKRVKITIYESY